MRLASNTKYGSGFGSHVDRAPSPKRTAQTAFQSTHGRLPRQPSARHHEQTRVLAPHPLAHSLHHHHLLGAFHSLTRAHTSQATVCPHRHHPLHGTRNTTLAAHSLAHGLGHHYLLGAPHRVGELLGLRPGCCCWCWFWFWFWLPPRTLPPALPEASPMVLCASSATSWG